MIKFLDWVEISNSACKSHQYGNNTLEKQDIFLDVLPDIVGSCFIKEL